MAKATQIKARNNSQEISLSHVNTDAPVLDVNGIERLQRIRPDIVDFIVEETRKEANARRERTKRTDAYIFIERIGALLLSVLIACGGIGGGLYAAFNGFESLGMTIAVLSIGTLAVAYIKRNK